MLIHIHIQHILSTNIPNHAPSPTLVARRAQAAMAEALESREDALRTLFNTAPPGVEAQTPPASIDPIERLTESVETQTESLDDSLDEEM
mmetsp:Transcript_63305/g.125122  ORF Transcript_63305/g.125122 Transcript_63305/m.125122 type:complete len:90 (+) Transcript_63305:200-469(+)